MREGLVDTLVYVCVTCLSKERNFSNVNDEIVMILKSLGVKLSTEHKICWECVAEVKKISRFKMKALKAQQMLQEGKMQLIEKNSLTTLKKANIMNFWYTPNSDLQNSSQEEIKSGSTKAKAKIRNIQKFMIKDHNNFLEVVNYYDKNVLDEETKCSDMDITSNNIEKYMRLIKDTLKQNLTVSDNTEEKTDECNYINTTNIVVHKKANILRKCNAGNKTVVDNNDSNESQIMESEKKGKDKTHNKETKENGNCRQINVPKIRVNQSSITPKNDIYPTVTKNIEKCYSQTEAIKKFKEYINNNKVKATNTQAVEKTLAADGLTKKAIDANKRLQNVIMNTVTKQPNTTRVETTQENKISGQEPVISINRGFQGTNSFNECEVDNPASGKDMPSTSQGAYQNNNEIRQFVCRSGPPASKVLQKCNSANISPLAGNSSKPLKIVLRIEKINKQNILNNVKQNNGWYNATVSKKPLQRKKIIITPDKRSFETQGVIRKLIVGKDFKGNDTIKLSPKHTSTLRLNKKAKLKANIMKIIQDNANKSTSVQTTSSTPTKCNVNMNNSSEYLTSLNSVNDKALISIEQYIKTESRVTENDLNLIPEDVIESHLDFVNEPSHSKALTDLAVNTSNVEEAVKYIKMEPVSYDDDVTDMDVDQSIVKIESLNDFNTESVKYGEIRDSSYRDNNSTDDETFKELPELFLNKGSYNYYSIEPPNPCTKSCCNAYRDGADCAHVSETDTDQNITITIPNAESISEYEKHIQDISTGNTNYFKVLTKTNIPKDKIESLNENKRNLNSDCTNTHHSDNNKEKREPLAHPSLPNLTIISETDTLHHAVDSSSEALTKVNQKANFIVDNRIHGENVPSTETDSNCESSKTNQNLNKILENKVVEPEIFDFVSNAIEQDLLEPLYFTKVNSNYETETDNRISPPEPAVCRQIDKKAVVRKRKRSYGPQLGMQVTPVKQKPVEPIVPNIVTDSRKKSFTVPGTSKNTNKFDKDTITACCEQLLMKPIVLLTKLELSHENKYRLKDVTDGDIQAESAKGKDLTENVEKDDVLGEPINDRISNLAGDEITVNTTCREIEPALHEAYTEDDDEVKLSYIKNWKAPKALYTMRCLKISELLMLREKEKEKKGFREAEYKCVKCIRTYARSQSLVVHHRLLHTFFTPHSCEICECWFDSKYQLRVHRAKHKRCVICKLCLEEFLDVRSVTEHMYQCHKTEALKYA